MKALFLSLLVGAIFLYLASANAHMVGTRLGPVEILAPHFVTLGVSYFLGFLTATAALMVPLLKRRKKTPRLVKGKTMVVKQT
ncbi:MAG: hypothetical protein HQL38_13620 [Alphaproteobacteria bacterium]|nr:hypothetical protein [Alphaproteobacteria bacterium]MBF0374013.1 hypothetical protein [Alphaproteobacteria bacterium]MBF0393712.1 hypothetical protein [Alphaproteobacteria bacterium]